MYNGQRGEMYALRILKVVMFDFIINHLIIFEISVLEAKGGGGGVRNRFIIHNTPF